MRRRDLLRLATGAGAIGTSAVCRARTESKAVPSPTSVLSVTMPFIPF